MPGRPEHAEAAVHDLSHDDDNQNRGSDGEPVPLFAGRHLRTQLQPPATASYLASVISAWAAPGNARASTGSSELLQGAAHRQQHWHHVEGKAHDAHGLRQIAACLRHNNATGMEACLGSCNEFASTLAAISLDWDKGLLMSVAHLQPPEGQLPIGDGRQASGYRLVNDDAHDSDDHSKPGSPSIFQAAHPAPMPWIASGWGLVHIVAKQSAAMEQPLPSEAADR